MNTEMIAVAMEKRKLNEKNYREQHKEERSTYGSEYYKKNKDRLCEIINCGCGGRFQYQGKAEHFKSKMHANFILKQETEEEQQKQRAEEDARLDAEFEIWNEAEQARRQALTKDVSEIGVYHHQVSKHCDLEKPTTRVYGSGNFGRFRSDYYEPPQPFWGLNQPGFRD